MLSARKEARQAHPSHHGLAGHANPPGRCGYN
jgi:hypothetical protein